MVLWAQGFPVMTAAQKRLSKTAQAFTRMDAARKEIAMRQEARRRARAAARNAILLITPL